MYNEIQETVPCKYCNRPTPMLGTKLCNSCWEISRHMRDIEPLLLKKILDDTRPETWIIAEGVLT